ncbi:Spermidine synthase [Seminavis robusta]|uniref:Spermidine synthase n=1 Tax=Seminavis robusta TaxID=568900 RepID=A0A9N8HJI5_9STRA|nr:Spermidine synthase [Seminavis robusta]|eukprot:Sro554_g165510.1 Spermidine synthase (1015) ;mRNA; f:24185-27313
MLFPSLAVLAAAIPQIVLASESVVDNAAAASSIDTNGPAIEVVAGKAVLQDDAGFVLNSTMAPMPEEDSDEDDLEEIGRGFIAHPDETFDPFTVEQLNLPFRWYQCDYIESHTFPGFLITENIKSPYQELEFYVHPKTGSACFDLDGILQQCTNFRPHYHEVGLHWAAQYVDKVERVLFVGGGDSMMLYEALKYPTVEKVVGLELDQTVTRYAYKYFGSQPHWDQHEKVEWWYGDASKSLLMLPKEYFGSFDLVIVDLSDTAMDMSVTTDLDVFGALSLLLKPEGILIKNEQVYFQHLRNIFDYTVRLHFDDVPHICTQNFILGSFGVDFLNKEPKDHGIIEDTLLLSKRESLTGRHSIMHDFVKNVTRPTKHCSQNNDETISEDQVRSPGVLMILETEDVTISLDPDDSPLEEIVTNVLESIGLEIVKTMELEGNSDKPEEEDGEEDLFSIEDGNDIAFVMKEGYLIARPFPEYDYIAFDIHLWSRFDIHNDIKRGLIKAVGSTAEKSSSSFRIAASGIFGVEGWKEDESKRGPRLTSPCEEASVSSTQTSMNPQVVSEVVNEAIHSFAGEEPKLQTVAVCGIEGEDCPILESLEANENVDVVTTLRPCGDLRNDLSMELCLLKLMQQMDQVSESYPIQMLVVDESATLQVGQLVYDLFNNSLASNVHGPRENPAFSRDDFVVMAPFRDESGSWRRAFLDRFRTDVVQNDPVSRGQVLFNTTDHSLDMGIVQSGNRDFATTFRGFVASVESTSGLSAEVRAILGGHFEFLEDFEAQMVYTPRDYEFQASLEQWNSQTPLGLQLVIQMEMLPWDKVLVVGETVEVEFEESEVEDCTLLAIYPNGTVDVEYIDEAGTTYILHDVDNRWVRKTGKPEKRDNRLNKQEVLAAFDEALSILTAIDYSYEHFVTEVGDGAAMVALCQAATIAAVWDGTSHIDVNVFSYVQDNGLLAEEFTRPFLRLNSLMQPILRDRQPRGVGRVVNFPDDLKEQQKKRPIWAKQRRDARVKKSKQEEA